MAFKTKKEAPGDTPVSSEPCLAQATPAAPSLPAHQEKGDGPAGIDYSRRNTAIDYFRRNTAIDYFRRIKDIANEWGDTEPDYKEPV